MAKKALVIGANGQDGQLLTKYLEMKNIEVLGVDKNNDFNMSSVEFLKHFFSITKISRLYYLAAYHHSSIEEEKQTQTEFQACFEVHVENIKNILEAIKCSSKETRVFYAGSSLVYGIPDQECVNENSPKNPICNYGKTKKIGMEVIQKYREEDGLFACSGILFNHESHLRSENFISRKIIKTALRIKEGKETKLIIGDLGAKTDWGYAPDFVQAFYKMLEASKPCDYVISSGKLHQVSDWIECAFGYLNLDWRKYVIEDKSLIKRQKPIIKGDNSKIKKELNCLLNTDFNDMVKFMLEKEIENEGCINI